MINSLSKSQFVLPLILSLAAITVFSQEGQPAKVFVEKKETAREIVNMGDSPIRVTRVITRSPVGQENGASTESKEIATYYFKRTGDKRVRAYVFVVESPGSVQIRYGIISGNIRDVVNEFGAAPGFKAADKQICKFDWIFFDDGSTWGPDDYGQSKPILDYVNGRETAINWAREWPEYPASNFLNDIIDGPGGSYWAFDPRSKMNKEVMGFDNGFKSVLTRLLSDAKEKNREVSAQLAAWLQEKLVKERKGK